MPSPDRRIELRLPRQMPSKAAAPSFDDDVALLVPAMQDLFAGVLEACGCEGDAGITRICQRLGVHRKLAWQVRNVATTADPFQAARFMPTRAGIDALVESLAAGKHGPSARRLAPRLRETAAAFDRLIEVHAGDRESLDMLVEARATRPDDPAEEKWREKAFQGNAFIFGAKARVQLSVTILNFAASNPAWFDMAQVRGLIGLKRVRPNVHWLVGQSVVLDGQGLEPRHPPRRTPLDAKAAAAMQGVPVMPELCSEPLPEIRKRVAAEGIVNYELLPAPVGFTGQQTVFTGEIVRELALIRATRPGEKATFATVVRTPCQVFVYDQFVHRDLFPSVTDRELCVFSELNAPVTQEDHDRLPVAERVRPLGRGLNAARTADLPGYLDTLRTIFARAGWNPDDFDLYRVRLAYPPLPAAVAIRHTLPE